MKNLFSQILLLVVFLFFTILGIASCNQATTQQTVTPEKTGQQEVKEEQKTTIRKELTPEQREKMLRDTPPGERSKEPQIERISREKYSQLSPEDKADIDAKMERGLAEFID